MSLMQDMWCITEVAVFRELSRSTAISATTLRSAPPTDLHIFKFGVARIVTTATYIDKLFSVSQDVAFIKINSPLAANLTNMSCRYKPFTTNGLNIGVVATLATSQFRPVILQAADTGSVNWTVFHSDQACSNDNGFNGNSCHSNETGYKGDNGYNGFRLESFSPDDAPIRDYSKGFQKSRNEERFLGVFRFSSSLQRDLNWSTQQSRLCLGGIEGAVGSVAGEALSTVASAQSAMANGNTSNAVKSATSSRAIECAVQTEASLQAMVVRINQEGGGLQRVVVFTGWYRNTGGDTEYTLDPPLPGSQEHATRVVIRRVAIAKAALETLMTLPRKMPDRLRTKASSHCGGEEGFYDVIKSGVQKTGPAVLYVAKKAGHTVILVIVVELSEKFKGAVGAESSAIPYN
ncbi:hypothetical protein CGCA056_v003902 [Colletotrichum aenigma]|uniref:uncharacterized protein n=1 Tax=Colletotrichum aenigma TaxID=1215731 RepID=UPI001872A1D8|nr:uncharacterized protein CGCA056_v003902 [Colletotrichum aenigma]KAF5526675.1 hypothetical protein CGCA056_v003902 [Colletotrichum aenigma]